jgi:methionyl-tRNA formyltransferase
VRIVFLGTPRVAVPSLRALAAAHEIPLVISQPDRPAGRVRVPVAPPVKLAAAELGIEVLQPTRLRARAFLDELGELGPDLLVVVAYGRILRRELLALAPVGAVNLHFSLLPRYRGAARRG